MKKLFSILIFAVLLTALSVTAFAAGPDIVASGFCGAEGDGTNLRWVLDSDGVLTISGEGAMADYVYTGYEWEEPRGYSSAPWNEYYDKASSLVLEEGITGIGNYAFYYMTSLSGNLVVPDSVISVGECAFFNCSGFEGEIILGSNLETVGEDSFAQCFNITGDLILPDSLKIIEDWAFSHMYDLRGKLVLGKNLEYIGDNAFYYDSFTEAEIKISEKVTYIGKGAFTDIWINSITVDENNDYYASEDGILYTKDFKTLMICPSGKTGDIVIDERTEKIEDYAFASCYGITGELVIPDNVITIGQRAFYNCYNVERLTLGKNVETVGSWAFAYLPNLSGELVLPESLVSVEKCAFGDCGFTGDLVIGKNLVSIGDGAFNGNKFKKVIVNEENPNYCSDGGALFNKDKTELEYFPGGVTGKYIIPEGTLTVGFAAFDSCSLSSIRIAESVTRIEQNAFYNIEGMTGIIIPENVEYIGTNAFLHGINNICFMGNAPEVQGAYEGGARSFERDANLCYFEGTEGWELDENGLWNDYEIKPVSGMATISVSSGVVAKGGTETVSVEISENSNAKMIQFALRYDHEVLSVVSCTAGDLTGDALINCDENGMIYFAWDGTEAITEQGALLNIEFAAEEEISDQETVIEFDENEKFIVAGSELKNIFTVTEKGTLSIVEAVYGDISGDGEVDIRDAYLARLIAAKLITPTGEQILCGDVDSDGKVTAIDANIIRKYCVKLIKELPIVI